MYAAELGLELDKEEVDIMAGENRKEPYTAKNPAGQMPCLELDDGSYISEITAICEYLDEVSPKTLMGDTPEERAETRMWTRRVDLNICENLANGFRYSDGLAIFKDRITTIPEAAEGLKQITREKLAWLDGLMEGKDYLCGDRLSLADILLYGFVSFGGAVGQPLPDGLSNIAAWQARMAERPSASA